LTTQHRALYDRDLLRTKFTVPQPGTPLIARGELLSRLGKALQSRVTLVAAPAGYGKTTLIAAWLAQSGQIAHPVKPQTPTASERGPRTGDLKFAWLTLDADDNDPVRFWRYIINACRVFDDPSASATSGNERLGQAALATLRASPPIDVHAMLTTFVNDLSQLSAPCVLVLDDLHWLVSSAILESLAYWLERLPSILHVILITRADSPLSLARLRSRGQLSEFHASDLRLTLTEAQQFAQQLLERPISRESVARLDEQLEGWPAGWRMALALALTQHRSIDRSNMPAEISLDITPQRTQPIIDFFVSEVLAAQPPEVQDFLLHTAFLRRLNGRLCDAVTARDDSQVILERLYRSNLFLQWLHQDTDGVWYRTHALFLEALQQTARQRIDANMQRMLSSRASAWFEKSDALPEAIDHALAARDTRGAAGLIERYLDQIQYGELDTLRRWLGQIPLEALPDRPAVLMAFANAILYTSDRFAATTHARLEPLLQQAEAYWRATSNTAGLGQVLGFRSVLGFWQGDLAGSIQYARAALQVLPDYEAGWRGTSLLAVGIDELRNGRLVNLPATLIEARALCAAAANKHAALAALIGLAEVHYARAEFSQATLYCSQVLDDASLPEFAADHQAAHVWLADIALARREFETAADHVARATHLGIPDEGPFALARAQLLQLHIDHAQGRMSDAQAALQQRVVAATTPETLRAALTLQAHLALADGNVELAQRALSNLRAAPARSRRDEESDAFLTAWVMCTQGHASQSVALIARWREDAHTNERMLSTMAWAAFEALAQASDDDSHARLVLGEAFSLAEREGIMQPFVEMKRVLDPVLARVFAPARGDDIEPFVSSLRALMHVVTQPATDHTPPTQPADTDPLSASETRVLRLLAVGMTNADIARELTVSINTVKTQVQSIFRKLKVTSRYEARELARRQKLTH